MSLTPQLVALCERPEADPGRDRNSPPLTDAEFETLAKQFDDDCGPEPFWVFAYGSLIWKPVFNAVEFRRATAFGWHRSFCLEMTRWRGSPAQPGLMMALARGGCCDGLAYRLPQEDRQAQIERIIRREVDTGDDATTLRWVPLQTVHGPVRALASWVGPVGGGVLHKLPLETVAKTMARACGHGGSCADYLYQTVIHLEAHSIRDKNLWRLQELVADEIRSIHGLNHPAAGPKEEPQRRRPSNVTGSVTPTFKPPAPICRL
ncbi:gamma-glutamylcyclotransferase [Mesorhizobium sp. DCY119]|nr:gamma-glutamylcyclotransferase [Mesorhizobium sp. DCY119]